MEEKKIYQQHRLRQMEFILKTAEELFIRHGTEKVTVTDIIRKTHLMRSTFYRYFNNKEDILWAVMQKHTSQFMRRFQKKIRESNVRGTYHLVSVFFEELFDCFQTEPETFLFIQLYKNSYMEHTRSRSRTEDIEGMERYESGSLIDLLLRDYPDESVRFPGPAYETGTMLIYAPVSFAAELIHLSGDLEAKYMVSSEKIFRIYLDSLLRSIQPESRCEKGRMRK